MKRTKLALSAVALIAGALGSAFTTKAVHKTASPSLYWYHYNAGEGVVTAVLLSGAQVTRTTAIADAPDGCNDTGATICAYGFSTPQSLPEAPTGAVASFLTKN